METIISRQFMVWGIDLPNKKSCFNIYLSLIQNWKKNMSLITKTTLFYLAIILIVFGIGGVTIYHEVKKVVALETDYALMYNFRLAQKALSDGENIESIQTEKIQISNLGISSIVDTNYAFSDTIAMHPQLKRLEAHRHLTTYRILNDTTYKFDLLEVFIEEDDVLEGVFGVISRLFIVLSFVLLLFSFLVSRKLFEPFKGILENINRFNLKKDEPINLPQTTTKEFKELNSFVEKMTQKARQDYISLKEFSENASHEMQTPIAVAQGKLELLLESPNLNPEQLGLIQTANESLSKLSKLGHALSLLTKIENEEFSQLQSIDFSKIVSKSFSNFQDIGALKGIKMESHLLDDVKLNIEPSLADILVSNLLKNAIQHNEEAGWVKLELNHQYLEISNSGKQPSLPTDHFFERFRKNNQTSASLGLGLPIVKKICEVNGLKIHYNYSDNVHLVNISF